MALVALPILLYFIYRYMDAEEPSEKSEEITICPRCGSKDLNHSNLGQGFFSPAGVNPVKMRCNACDFIGLPIILDKLKDYENFLEEIKMDEGRKTRMESGSPGMRFHRKSE